MPLTPGTRLGPYKVTAQIGVGGMGEVYRATDTRLQRDVAIKVLPEGVARDPGRLARFEREARALAALNHPNIAQIHGLEESDGLGALVMELVEGPTLADRIAQGAIPLDEALAIAKQIAEALEAAHEMGIIHRDLKPANIKVRPDGAVKVLDFGLAKMMDLAGQGAGPAGREGSADELPTSQSPTITAPAMTQAGAILGTAGYMSPEQAKGRPADRRSDIWAFAAVLYEMLTGTRAFPGSSAADVLGAVIHKQPDWDRLPVQLSPVLRRFLYQCLSKSPFERVRDMGDLRLAIGGAFDPEQTSEPSRPQANPWWTAAALVFTGVVSGLLAWNLRSDAPDLVSRFSHALSADQAFTQSVRPLVAVAPDGTSVVYVADDRLYRRAMGELEAAPILGTDGTPSGPFFSPDGRTIGYWDFTTAELRAISVEGGAPVTLASASSFYSASWGPDDTIVYAQEDGVWRLASSGGTPTRIVGVVPGERVHGPQMLPDGRTVIFTLVTLASIAGSASAWDSAEVVAQSIDTGERTVLVRGSDARYVPTGYLVFARTNTLLAVRFDPTSLAVAGRPVPVVEGVRRAVRTPGSSGTANYAFSRNGTLVYVPAEPEVVVKRKLVSVDRTGRATPLVDEERFYWRPRMSPDGTRVAVEVLAPGLSGQIWIVDVARRLSFPLTGEGEETPFVSWAPDSQSVVYRSNRGGRLGIYRQTADGSGDVELLLESSVEVVPTDVSRDGVLAFAEGPQTGARRILLLRAGEESVSDFLDTPAWEHMAVFSPDARWIAYASNESGQMEVYVRPYPRAPGVARRVSDGGGVAPVWAPDGRTLFYRGVSGDLLAVETTLTPGFSAGPPRPLFRFDGVYVSSGNAAAYDVSPDGSRFVMVTVDPNQIAPTQRIHVVANWFRDLSRLVPVD